jgi:hypothetical protein
MSRRWIGIIPAAVAAVVAISDPAPAQQKSAPPAAPPPQMKCETGPVPRMFGEVTWMVYSCDDQKSLILVAPQGSAAHPFMFLIAQHDGRYKVNGEGTAGPEARAALKDLSMLTHQEIGELIQATKKH